VKFLAQLIELYHWEKFRAPTSLDLTQGSIMKTFMCGKNQISNLEEQFKEISHFIITTRYYKNEQNSRAFLEQSFEK
jgi:hypothetical protein